MCGVDPHPPSPAAAGPVTPPALAPPRPANVAFFVITTIRVTVETPCLEHVVLANRLAWTYIHPPHPRPGAATGPARPPRPRRAPQPGPGIDSGVLNTGILCNRLLLWISGLPTQSTAGWPVG